MKIIREGHGSGEGRAASPGEVHDTAFKAAETDATKRALATFGKPFGLELYRKDNIIRPEAASPSPPLAPSEQAQRFGLQPDDTTPIPRPSHYYGRRHQSMSSEFFPKAKSETNNGTAAPPLAPAASEGPPQDKIDKSQLVFGEPKRLRDKAHLKFVASQPCLVCGRTPLRSTSFTLCSTTRNRA